VGKTLISLQQVSLRYPDGRVFCNINFELEEGQHIALTGHNTPLKYALLDALSGRVAITGGYKLFDLSDSVPATDPLHHPNKVVFVSARHQFKNLSHTADFYYQQRFNSCDADNAPTVQEYLENIAVNVHHKGWTYAKAIEQLHIKPLLSETVIKLSNGETKRVLVAAALLQNPVLLVLQNPFAGLDADSRPQLKALIDLVANAGIAIVLSTPDDDLPSTITHIATVGLHNSIRILPKAAYAPKAHQPLLPTIETAAVKALLNPHLPVFETIVQMKNVHIAYDAKVILHDINWTIRQGERWVLSGENGAGKSTLLSLINGDNPQAFANDIILFDRRKGSGESIWDIKKKTGFFSPELYQYFPVDTSCVQAVESGFFDTIGLFRPSNPARATVAKHWLDVLDMGHQAHKLLRNVPAVEQRLCLLARAMVKSPVLLILDEPCQGFDEQQTVNFKAVIDTICANSDMTIIYVSHYQNEIPGSITKLYKLHNGRQVT